MMRKFNGKIRQLLTRQTPVTAVRMRTALNPREQTPQAAMGKAKQQLIVQPQVETRQGTARVHTAPGAWQRGGSSQRTCNGNEKPAGQCRGEGTTLHRASDLDLRCPIG